jgi:hypothetical protein
MGTLLAVSTDPCFRKSIVNQTLQLLTAVPFFEDGFLIFCALIVLSYKSLLLF